MTVEELTQMLIEDAEALSQSKDLCQVRLENRLPHPQMAFIDCQLCTEVHSEFSHFVNIIGTCLRVFS